MSIYIMRHGATYMNVEQRVQGHIDDQLSDIGRQQTLLAKEAFGEMKLSFCRVFSSPLIRTVQTAAIAAGCSEDDVIRLEDLIEIDFGTYDGRYYHNMTREEHDSVFNYATPKPVEEGVETYESLMARVRSFIEYARSGIDRDGDVLVVAHGGVLRGIISHIEDIPKEDFWSFCKIPNCKTYRMDLAREGTGFKDRIESVYPGTELKPD